MIGRPGTSFRPTMRTSFRSNNVRTTPEVSTPRISSISERTIGCLYAMIARDSSADRDSFAADLVLSRRLIQVAYSCLVTRRNPPAISTSLTPRPSCSNSSPRPRRACATSAFVTSPMIATRRCTDKGSGETNNRDSTIPRSSRSAIACTAPSFAGAGSADGDAFDSASAETSGAAESSDPSETTSPADRSHAVASMDSTDSEISSSTSPEVIFISSVIGVMSPSIRRLNHRAQPDPARARTSVKPESARRSRFERRARPATGSVPAKPEMSQ